MNMSQIAFEHELAPLAAVQGEGLEDTLVGFIRTGHFFINFTQNLHKSRKYLNPSLKQYFVSSLDRSEGSARPSTLGLLV